MIGWDGGKAGQEMLVIHVTVRDHETMKRLEKWKAIVAIRPIARGHG